MNPDTAAAPREFNIRNILAGQTARFQRATADDLFYYVWVTNDNSPIVLRQSPMKPYEFAVNRADIPSLGGMLQAGEPAEKLAPFIALAIERGTFVEVA